MSKPKKPPTVTPRQRAVLRAVAEGRVQHVHPFTWALPLDLYDLPGAKRTLEGLANRGLVRVEASSREHQRPVHLTDAGRAAIESPTPTP